MSFDLENYDPADPALQQNPFPHYARLRREAPVFRHPKSGTYFVSRYDTVREVLGNPGLFSSRRSNAATLPSDPAVLKRLGEIAKGAWLPPAATLVTADPPVHTPYRKGVAPLLAPRRIRALEDAIRDIAIDLVEAWPKSGRVDFKQAFALPLPVRVICHVLGVKAGVEADIERWSDDSVAALGADIEDERRLEAMRGIVEMQHFWAEEIEKRRERPTPDFVSELIAVKVNMPGEEPRSLTMHELLSVIVQVMVAGKEATTKGLSEILLLLAKHPDEWQRLRDDPERIPLAIEEGLRMASPNQGLYRHSVEDAELEGVAIPKDSTLWVMFGSANRDESHFEDPDGFNPDRANLRDHLAFGVGAHFCLGAPLARAELRIGIEEIVKRVGTLDLPADFEPRYDRSFILRGLENLELDLTG
jgi:cytochrome P450